MVRRALAAVAALALMLPVGAPRAEDLAGGLARCAEISDSLQRLICYDALARETGALPRPATPAPSRAATPARTEVGGRCQAITKKGTQCSRNARAGSSYCWQHGG